MGLKRICELYERLRYALTGIGKRSVYYVTDKSHWSFYWDAYYITKGLKERQGLHAKIIHNPWGLKKQIIHFGNRYAYLNGPFRSLHSSNYVFLTWFHGDSADPNPAMQHLFEVLPETVGYVKKIVVTCHISRKILVELGIPGNKIVKIPLGVDLARFYPSTVEFRLSVRASLGIPKNVFCIGYFQKDGVGWEEGNEPKLIKGPDVFLEVVSNLSAHINNLLILLTGPARGYVKQGLEKMGIPYIHRYLSDYHDIVSYYQALDLYIISSRSEGGPKALLESWATGVPVVSTRVGMAADLIKHGENGMLADLEDVRSLTNHSLALIKDVNLREQCCRQALEDVKQYDWSLIAEKYYQELYHPLLM